MRFRAHLSYAWYCFKHKWYVLIECWKLGLFWQGIIHDLSKFTFAEWTPYVLSFYGGWAYKDRPPEVVAAFDAAWLHHIHANPHHPEHWILPNEASPFPWRPVRVPACYLREMVADWIATGKTKGFNDMPAWYDKNRAEKARYLHPLDLAEVDALVDSYRKSPCTIRPIVADEGVPDKTASGEASSVLPKQVN